MKEPKQSFTIYCRGKCTGKLITKFSTTEGLNGALDIANNPNKYIEILNDHKVVAVKRPILIVVN